MLKCKKLKCENAKNCDAKMQKVVMRRAVIAEMQRIVMRRTVIAEVQKTCDAKMQGDCDAKGHVMRSDTMSQWPR